MDTGPLAGLDLSEGAGQSPDEGLQSGGEEMPIFEAWATHCVADVLLMHPAFGIFACNI